VFYRKRIGPRGRKHSLVLGRQVASFRRISMQGMAKSDQRGDALEEVDRAQSPDGFGLERIG